MHASFVPAPPPPPEPPAVLRAMTRPELTGRSGPIGGPPNPPLLSCPRRGPGSASAGHPHPPVPRAPPDAPTNQQLYGVSRHQPPPPASAPPQVGVGLLPIPTGNTFTCSRRGPPPPPPFSEREERERDAFATRASGAVGIRAVRLPESHPAARGPYPQTEVLHISRRHSAHETANCLDLSHRGDADPAETPQMSHGDPPPPVSSRERQDNAQNLDGFRHLHRQHADYSYEDAGFCDHDRLRGPRDFSLPQEPREAFNREPRQGREQSPVVLVLQSRHGDRGDSRQWPPERTDQRQYETDKDLEKGAYRAVLKDRPDSPGRRSRMDDEPNSSEYSPRECVPADFSRATAGAPSTSSQCASRQLPPLRVNSASAADWRRFPSSESPSRIFREMPRRFEGADTPRRSRGLSSPRHSGFPWHQPPSQLTPSPCSQALSRLPPSPITPFGVAGPQRSPGGAPPLPVERRSPQNSGSLDDRRLGGSDGQRGEGKKRSRDFPQDDVSPLQPAAPPVVLTVRGGLSHSRSGLEVEAGRPESRPATERQRRRKQRQQQRRQRARRRQQNQQGSCTGGSSVRESPRDNHSVCGQDEEPERSSRGNQTVTATSSLPLMVRRASNLSESTDSDQEAERATGEERQQDNDDPWAASLEDIEQHLKKRKTTDFDVAAKSAHFPERADATAAIDFPAGCQVPPNCDELFLPPWRERQKSSNGRVVYQFELLQQGHLAAPWHRLTGASSPDGHRISQHAVVAKCSSRHSQNPHSFGRGRQEPSVGRGREPRFESQMVSSVDGECNPPKDSYPPASCTDGDHGRADDTIYDSGLAARGPGSSCSSNSSRRTSMSTCHNQEQWGTEHTRGSENSDTCFWTNERVQRSLLTPSTRAPTEGEGNQDSRFHAGVNYEECEAQKDESFRRESDTIRPTRCYDAAQEGWWSDWTIQLKRRENRVHEKDGHSNMMLPPVQWC